MNKERRKEIQRAWDMIAEAKEILQTAKDEEEEYRDNMPENLQGSDRYAAADAAVDALDNAINSLDEVDSEIETALE